MVRVPKYVLDILERSEFEFDRCKENENYSVGYTLRIRKQTKRTLISTFEKEIQKLKKWVENQEGGECYILYIPSETHYCWQYAVVTIYDPIMQRLEKYM